MNGIIREEFSRAFINRRFFLVALLSTLSFTYGFNQVINVQAADPLGAVVLWQQILLRGSYGFFAALMAGLPFADSLLQDHRHNYLDQILMRCRYNQYLMAKFLATMVSGMAVVLIPALILLAACCLSYPLNAQAIIGFPSGFSSLTSPNVIEPGAPMEFSQAGFALLSMAMLAAFGAAYAMIGLASSFLIRNPFVVLGLPFIIYSLGYYIIPTSVRLNWLGSTQAALLPVSGLFSPVTQYLALLVLFLIFLALAGRKEHQISI